MSPFVVDLATLKPGLNPVSLEGGAAELDLPANVWHGGVRADLDVEKTGDQVTVRGRVQGLAGFECVRCLKPFEFPVEVPLEVYADRASTGRRIAEERELERDDYMRFHDGRHLDLLDSVREVLLLDLPMAPRCREDCRGLCPRCGADLNEGPCSCNS
jgi:uncharacterized protein